MFGDLGEIIMSAINQNVSGQAIPAAQRNQTTIEDPNQAFVIDTSLMNQEPNLTAASIQNNLSAVHNTNQAQNPVPVNASHNQETHFTASDDFSQTALPTQAPVAQQLAEPVANIEQALANYLTSLQAIKPENPEANDPMAFIQNLIAQSPLAGFFGGDSSSEISAELKAALEQLPQLEQVLTAKITSLLGNPQFITYADNADVNGAANADPVVAATVEAIKSQTDAKNTEATIQQARSIYLSKAISPELAQAHQQVVNAQATNDPQGPEAMFATVIEKLAPAFGQIMQQNATLEQDALTARMKEMPNMLTILGEGLISAAKAMLAKLRKDTPQVAQVPTTAPAASQVNTTLAI